MRGSGRSFSSVRHWGSIAWPMPAWAWRERPALLPRGSYARACRPRFPLLRLRCLLRQVPWALLAERRHPRMCRSRSRGYSPPRHLQLPQRPLEPCHVVEVFDRLQGMQRHARLCTPRVVEVFALRHRPRQTLHRVRLCTRLRRFALLLRPRQTRRPALRCTPLKRSAQHQELFPLLPTLRRTAPRLRAKYSPPPPRPRQAAKRPGPLAAVDPPVSSIA